MQSIRAFSLHNGGGFVCRIKANGKELTKNINLGQTKVGTLSESGLHTGAEVELETRVISGKNNTAHQRFIYDPNSQLTAYYTITGTTLNNTLGLIEVK
jgi:hypothetical protein